MSFLGGYFGVAIIDVIGRIFFAILCIVGFVSSLIFMSGITGGKYKGIQEKSWKEQLW